MTETDPEPMRKPTSPYACRHFREGGKLYEFDRASELMRHVASHTIPSSPSPTGVEDGYLIIIEDGAVGRPVARTPPSGIRIPEGDRKSPISIEPSETGARIASIAANPKFVALTKRFAEAIDSVIDDRTKAAFGPREAAAALLPAVWAHVGSLLDPFETLEETRRYTPDLMTDSMAYRTRFLTYISENPPSCDEAAGSGSVCDLHYLAQVLGVLQVAQDLILIRTVADRVAAEQAESTRGI